MNDNKTTCKRDPSDLLDLHEDIYFSWNIFHISISGSTDKKSPTATVSSVQIGMDISRSGALCKEYSYENLPEWMQEKLSMIQVLGDVGENIVGVGIQLSPTDFWVYEHEGDRE